MVLEEGWSLSWRQSLTGSSSDIKYETPITQPLSLLQHNRLVVSITITPIWDVSRQFMQQSAKLGGIWWMTTQNRSTFCAKMCIYSLYDFRSNCMQNLHFITSTYSLPAVQVGIVSIHMDQKHTKGSTEHFLIRQNKTKCTKFWGNPQCFVWFLIKKRSV